MFCRVGPFSYCYGILINVLFQAASALRDMFRKFPVLYNSSIVISFEPKVIYKVIKNRTFFLKTQNLFLILIVFWCPVHRCVRLTPMWSRVSLTVHGDWAVFAMALLGLCRHGVRCGQGFWMYCWTGPTTTYCGSSVESLPSSCRKTSSHCRWN